jgi:hypothetical protein
MAIKTLIQAFDACQLRTKRSLGVLRIPIFQEVKHGTVADHCVGVTISL